MAKIRNFEMPSVTIVSALLITFTCCTAANIQSSSSAPILNDKSNWRALWKVLKENRTDGRNASVFDRIIFANARDRATAKQGDGVFLYQGDIRMRESQARRLFNASGGRSRRAALRRFEGNRWSRNSLTYELHSSLTTRGRRAIREAIEEWEKVLPCLGKWRDIRQLRDKPKAYIQFYRGSGCNSPVGRLGRRQKISIGKGCESKVIAVHEIGHAMGMWHEQSRPDRDKYVKILWNNIIPAWRSAFRKIPSSLVNSFGVEYDYESVMHYPEGAFAKSSGLRTMQSRVGHRQLGNTQGLTPKDIEQVQKMYNCVEKPKRNPEECRDKTKYCIQWKHRGYCKPGNRHYKYMKLNCCKSCSVVRACTDRSKYCTRWKDVGYCKLGNPYHRYMRKNCCKACSDACRERDASSVCQDWYTVGYCKHPTFAKFVRSYCKKSCLC